MVEQEDVLKAQAPSKKAIAKATAIALIVAVVILFTAVLPAEYGIDPLGTGKTLHFCSPLPEDFVLAGVRPPPEP